MKHDMTLKVAEVQIREQDGSIHAYSAEIPGLHVCGTDRNEVLEDVITAIKFLYKEIRGVDIDAKWVESPSETFNRDCPAERVAMYA